MKWPLRHLYEMLLRRRRNNPVFPPFHQRARALNTRARALAEPQLDKRQRAEDSAGSVETQQDD